ncbi:UbiA family prenyltransferase [Streptomyces sp. NBC_01707]|uniref:SCO3242 family prenyltransferase n=1 Tax=unclassified Streptomyces TaxID=2593676 RepID=UPI0008914047|nr:MULTISPECIES: UbiA family prenyltransferase [unclassified Streptomyces]MDX3771110.1 UbiA family prenyltransferase [Streptomyces sp. AK08-01B]MDX3820643.1 UbiA family prenyltransferase [Streptomyces sp. AK08-01A]SCZ16275.1 4-hydroxybenzoate polyprenyltransferase [Streptomyces sp. 136MFCol5.1]SFT30137.1 4-hydroxybenzoate polyprenyltransferase [Streptomyces sp. ok210]
MRAAVRAWAELLRVSALFTVPGDALAGAAALGRRPGRGTALAVGASLCLYEAGMALNDWADRDEDAIDRPHRPIPSGRITPGAALAAAGALTAAGLTMAARAGRPALTVATGLAATVWAYDLRLKHTQAGPAAMAAARALDLLLGATATAGTGAASVGVERPAGANGTSRAARSARILSGARTPGPAQPTRPARTAHTDVRAALPAAALLGAHTYAVTAVSRHEAQGGSTAAPLGALAAIVALGAAAVREQRGSRDLPPVPGKGGPGDRHRTRPGAPAPRVLLTALTATYLRTAAEPLLHATLNPSPPLTQRAVGSGIRAMIPLQAVLAARAGAAGTGLAVMGLVPLARTLARKVSLT